MEQQKHPDLSILAATMAANQAKVDQFVETLSRPVDELVSATLRHDWPEVQRVGGQLAEQGRAAGFRSVSAMAQRVVSEAHRPENDVAIKQSMIRLIGTCGRAGTPQDTTS